MPTIILRRVLPGMGESSRVAYSISEYKFESTTTRNTSLQRTELRGSGIN